MDSNQNNIKYNEESCFDIYCPCCPRCNCDFNCNCDCGCNCSKKNLLYRLLLYLQLPSF